MYTVKDVVQVLTLLSILLASSSAVAIFVALREHPTMFYPKSNINSTIKRYK